MFLLFTIILFLILVFILLVPSMIFSLISSLLSLFSFSRKKTDKTGNRSEERVQYSRNTEEDKKNKKKKRGKFFDKNEGEYVDFEELK